MVGKSGLPAGQDGLDGEEPLGMINKEAGGGATDGPPDGEASDRQAGPTGTTASPDLGLPHTTSTRTDIRYMSLKSSCPQPRRLRDTGSTAVGGALAATRALLVHANDQTAYTHLARAGSGHTRQRTCAGKASETPRESDQVHTQKRHMTWIQVHSNARDTGLSSTGGGTHAATPKKERKIQAHSSDEQAPGR